MLGIRILCLIVLTAGASHAQIHAWRDDQGIFHFRESAVPGAKPFDVGHPVRHEPPATDRSGDHGPALRPAAGPFDGIIHETANRYGVEPELVKAVIRVESRFDPQAVSPRGARGLMQIMPFTARWYGVSDPHDPRQNIRAGVRYLRSLLDRFGDPRLALAAYNAGPTVVARYDGLPPFRETRAYVERVMRVRTTLRRTRD
jgi:soluble lytic murein transglycosylase-like protein